MSLQAPVQYRGVRAALQQICPISIIIIVVIIMITLRIPTRSLNTTYSHGMSTLPVLLDIMIWYNTDSHDAWQMSYVNLRLFLIISLHRNFKDPPNAPHGSFPQCVAPSRDVIHEVSVDRSYQAGPGPATREIKRTINLPEECSKAHWSPCMDMCTQCSAHDFKECNRYSKRCFTGFLLTGNVFITYSVDTANEIIPFVKFLTDQGFEPAVSPVMSHITFDSQWLSTQTLTLPLSW